MQTIKELKQEYSKNLQIAEMDLSNWDRRTVHGMLGLQSEAKRKIDEVTVKLASAILANSTVLVKERGPELLSATAFSNVSNSGSQVLINYLAPEEMLFAKAFQGVSGSFSIDSSCISKLNVILSEYASEVGIETMETIPANNKYFAVYSSQTDAVKAIEAILEDVYSGDLKSIIMRSELRRIATERCINDGAESLQIGAFNVPNNRVQVFASVGNVVLVNKENLTEDVALVSNKKTKKVSVKQQN